MDLLYAIRGCAVPQSTKSHAAFSFFVSQGYEQLAVAFTYCPSSVTDDARRREITEQALAVHQADEEMKRLLSQYGYEYDYKNLLTLSLDDPRMYRGAVHRFACDQKLVISEKEASPGFICGPVLPGMWRATISFHAVYSAECEFDLKVWGVNGK